MCALPWPAICSTTQVSPWPYHLSSRAALPSSGVSLCSDDPLLGAVLWFALGGRVSAHTPLLWRALERSCAWCPAP